MKYAYLSYYTNENTPLYGGEKSIFIEDRSVISDGASSNTKYLKLPNHSGTHVDFPNHFSDSGKIINNYLASFWIFKEVCQITYIAQYEEIIGISAFEGFNIQKDVEFIILYTGIEKVRNSEDYWNRNPGLSPELASYLRIRCPKLKAIGFDFISVSSYQNRLLGREAHKTFLLENDILLIEDMKLDEIHSKTIKSLIALPLLIDKIDGAPITIIAEYE